jgi:hypothetical protein
MSVRSRIQRAFLAWLDEASPRVGQRIIPRRRTDRVICFDFDVGSPLLHGWLDRHEIVITVGDDESTRDLLLVLNAFPERSPFGVVCSQCARNEQRVFASREELWCDHLFEPLLRWVNDELAPAVAIALFEYDGATEAKLVTSWDETVKAAKAIALR